MDILFPAHRARRLSLAVDVQRVAPRQEAITTVYPDDTWRLGLALGGYLRHRIHPTLTGGVMRFEGNGIGQFSGTPSAETSTLWVFPVQLSMEYLFDYSWDQILIPYVGGGVDGWTWKESSPDAATSGVKWGLHGSAGVMLRLNFMETTTRWAQGSASHASDAGVTAGLTYAWIDSFGHGGLDFSGLSFGVGGVVAF